MKTFQLTFLKVRSKISAEAGQTAIEYAFMLALVALVVATFAGVAIR